MNPKETLKLSVLVVSMFMAGIVAQAGGDKGQTAQQIWQPACPVEVKVLAG